MFSRNFRMTIHGQIQKQKIRPGFFGQSEIQCNVSVIRFSEFM